MEHATERWLPVVGFEGRYEVSDRGRVRSTAAVFPRWVNGVEQIYHRKEYVKKLTRHPAGYMYASLFDRQTGRENGYAKVHRLVLEAFVGPCPDGMEACHGNDVPGDNRLENLRWDTKRANHADKVARRTHCKWGHEYTPENTRVYRRKRQCRTCSLDAKARDYDRKHPIVLRRRSEARRRAS